jgi:two-component system, NarL family, sensor kinase
MMPDMTPDRAARAREQRAQHMLRRVVGASPDVIYVYHVPWRRIAFLGHRVREVLGFAAVRSQRLGLADFERLVHPADLAGFRRHLAAVERAPEGAILTQELRIKGADGHYRWLRSRDTVLARTDAGAVSRIIGVVSDIDEAKRAAHELPASIARLDDILSTIGDCYIALDRDYRIVDMNAKAESWLKTRRDDVVGRSYRKIIAPSSELADAVRQAVERRLSRTIEIQSQRRPGTWLELHIHPSPDGASILFRDITDAKQAKEALSELSGRLSSLREEERQRIAQELHDSTAQHLVAATLNLMTLKAKSVAYPGVHKLLETVEASLEEATRELRVFTYLLHPLALENDGLERTLRTYLDGFARRTGLSVHMDAVGKVDTLGFDLQCSLLRIIQEALANVHRHACATHVSISLRMTDSVLRLVIADDGRGMCGATGPVETIAARSGVGIPGMRSRLRDFGGSLDIRSSPRGTTLSALVPLDAATPRSRTRERRPELATALAGNPHRT